VYFNFYIYRYRQRMGSQNILNWMVASSDVLYKSM